MEGGLEVEEGVVGEGGAGEGGAHVEGAVEACVEQDLGLVAAAGEDGCFCDCDHVHVSVVACSICGSLRCTDLCPRI